MLIPSVAALALAVAAGWYGLMYSSAATFFAHGEAEAGVVAGNAGPGDTAGASNGASVKFGSGSAQAGGLNLPRIPWEGGPAYYEQFPVAKAGGWTDPNFFPFAVWYNGVSSDAEVIADRSYGVNTYIGQDANTDYNLYANNHSYTLNKLNNEPAGAPYHPGTFLEDEPDGRTTSANDLLTIKNLVAASPNDGRFKQINFSATVLSNAEPNTNKSNLEQMVNAYDGPASVDKYFYTIPSCFDIGYIIEPIDAGHCRTASSYGAVVRALRTRDAADGKLKPIWNFIENLSGAPDPQTFYAYITAGQLEGAVMNSIINEARGILYFNQSFSGTCVSGNVMRQAEMGNLNCAVSQLNAMKEVGQRVKALAPVINTQSYQYSFGANLDTMLKWYNGSAYVFAMISGDAGSAPGSRSFTLPPDLAKASAVQVVDENRTLPVSGGKFTDNFAAEYTYHIYKITP